VFPFVKGTEYEMSLESSDELIIVQRKVEEVKSDSSDTKERWSSIDELTASAPPKSIELSLEPPLEEFSKQVLQFLGFNKNYGDGWLTALKVKVYGSWATGTGKVILKDLGLVPGNYVESA
jgi:hypothetical protein